jgi:hypothetical protein
MLKLVWHCLRYRLVWINSLFNEKNTTQRVVFKDDYPTSDRIVAERSFFARIEKTPGNIELRRRLEENFPDAMSGSGFAASLRLWLRFVLRVRA